eukprot:TRINITY_DN107290_c0_g1_i1.p1 TRINITY_DN107290_c0_g1~~TRINITY_DN107290_c0_g1_i1.p1  ORF type:complete len:416 (-),score=145.77 TRINITY_DN107290_c0_g1_i1:21-1160(-)
MVAAVAGLWAPAFSYSFAAPGRLLANMAKSRCPSSSPLGPAMAASPSMPARPMYSTGMLASVAASLALAVCLGRPSDRGMRRLKRLVVCAAEGETTKETPEAAEPADEEKAEDAADEPEAKGWEGEEEQDAEETDEKEEKEEGEGEEDGGEESAEKKPSKWTCLDCGSPNFASSTECDKCGASRPSPEEAALMQARNDAKDEIAKVMDSFLRDQADLQNYRREHTESMSRAEDLGKRDALKKLLPINEDIEAAIAEPEGMDEKAKAIFDSYSLLFRKVGDVWTKGGVETFSAEAGEKFDPVRHVMVEEREASEDEKPGTVAEIVKSGWKCDGKVVLPSQVVVLSASVAEEEEAPAKDAEGTEEETAAEEEEKKDEQKDQ